MNLPTSQQSFSPAEKVLKDTFTAGNVQAFAEKSVAATQDLFTKSVAATQNQHKALTEIADTAWAGSKLLNEKVANSVSVTIEMTLSAVQEMASAKSLPELSKLQAELGQKLATQSAEQVKDFFDHFTRITRQVAEISQTAAAKAFKSTH